MPITVNGSGTISSCAITDLHLDRTDSASEGGQLNLKRSSDNAGMYAIDVFGATSAPDCRIINLQAGTEVFKVSSVGNVTVSNVSVSGSISAVNSGLKVLVATVTGSGAASLDYTGFTSTYRNYEVVAENITPSTNAVSLFMRMHGAGAFLTGTYYNSNFTVFNNNTGAYSGGSTTYAQVWYTNYLLSATGSGVSGRINFYNTSSASTYKNYDFMLSGPGVGAGYSEVNIGGGWYITATTALTGFQLYTSSGNISGTIRIYGYN